MWHGTCRDKPKCPFLPGDPSLVGETGRSGHTAAGEGSWCVGMWRAGTKMCAQNSDVLGDQVGKPGKVLGGGDLNSSLQG